MAFEQAGLLKLGEHAIDRGKADVHIFGDEEAVNVLGGQVAGFDLLEEVKNLEPWEGCLQADTFEVLGVARHGEPRKTGEGGRKPGQPRMI